MKEMSPSNDIIVNCNDGGKELSQERLLNGHIETVHEEKKPFNCNDCGKPFAQRRSLNGYIEFQQK